MHDRWDNSDIATTFNRMPLNMILSIKSYNMGIWIANSQTSLTAALHSGQLRLMFEEKQRSFSTVMAWRQCENGSLTGQHQNLVYALDVFDLPAITRKIYSRLRVCRNKKNVAPKSKWAQKCKADSVFFLYVNIIDEVLWTCSFYTELVLCFTFFHRYETGRILYIFSNKK